MQVMKLELVYSFEGIFAVTLKFLIFEEKLKKGV